MKSTSTVLPKIMSIFLLKITANFLLKSTSNVLPKSMSKVLLKRELDRKAIAARVRKNEPQDNRCLLGCIL
jgi:hypothetical protein